MSKAPPYLEHDFDPRKVDVKELARELKALRAELDAEAGPEDIAHLEKIERWGKLCTMLGYGTAWMAPNPVSSVLISQGVLTRWLLMHHISHRGYDKVPGIDPKYTSKVFGKGWRRLIDWMDWIYPEAWHEEHDFLHHYHLGEDDDPDLLERNTEWMREQDLPGWLQKLLVGLLAGTWKWVYYAPSTLDELQKARARRAKEPAPEPAELLSPFNERGRELWLKCLIPHALWRFGAIPAMFAPLGPVAVGNVLLNTLGAELFTNIHAFLIIGPNHTGEDLYRFDEPVEGREEFYLRQIVGSANYACGNEFVDWTQMWLNYQIEHHIWPDLTMLQYRKVQPKVKALCERMGIPYVQESVFVRAKKMIDVILGKAKMRRVDGLV
ncbi:fatty acid desaturase family protein [Persicimonas caeni]|uniref:fatty acid desaturase family protein n=1 Tax=Persicimonas caeni TaxID=2292766 RepID=UPI001C9A2F96|nr:fatty acid desaturase [Persicimonas caeni]